MLRNWNQSYEARSKTPEATNAVNSLTDLHEQGNAADAMVGTNLCVGVIGMYHSGIGGGGFMLVRDKHGGYESIDYRETAPAAAFRDMYKDNVNGSIYGGLAVGIPGELRGLEYLHKKYGVSLPLAPFPTPGPTVVKRASTDELLRSCLGRRL